MPDTEPMPVLIADTQPPVPVVIAPLGTPTPTATVTSGQGTVLTPNTTEADDKVTAGQRRINLVWEYTQSAISLMIVSALIYCAVNGIVSDGISNAAFLVIGFYFSRTNHQAVGGVGAQPSGAYTGR